MNGVNPDVSDKRYVLVVDPDIDDRFYACMLLQRFGYTIFAARTTEKAVEFITVSPPAAIIADADTGGSTLLSELTQDPRFFDIPVILLSWWHNAALEDRARKEEFVAYLRKPVNVLEFYRFVQTAVGKSPRRNLRVATHLMVTLEDSPEEVDGFVTVISEFGMFLRTLRPRPVQTRVRVAVRIRGRLIRLETAVLYSVTFDEGPFKEPGMGLKFITISREDRELIAAFILERIGEGIARQSPRRDRGDGM
jgi:CheY-like chemotaxis protein